MSAPRIVVVGVGGLGTPALLALAHAAAGTLVLVDDDLVDETNLHRQILFRHADVGRHKLDAAADALERAVPGVPIEKVPARLHPGNALDLLRGASVVVECSDNYATKFLCADAARLVEVPVVHGAAVRWVGTAFAVARHGAPCYRCLFEDIPAGAQAGCDVAGVVGPVCGVIGALQADFALKFLAGVPIGGRLATLDGLRDDLRLRTVRARPSCPLCGTRSIEGIDPARYLA